MGRNKLLSLSSSFNLDTGQTSVPTAVGKSYLPIFQGVFQSLSLLNSSTNHCFFLGVFDGHSLPCYWREYYWGIDRNSCIKLISAFLSHDKLKPRLHGFTNVFFWVTTGRVSVQVRSFKTQDCLALKAIFLTAYSQVAPMRCWEEESKIPTWTCTMQ